MKKMWKGNHALAEAAVRAGCEFYSGYPITPQTEVMEYLSSRLPELGRTFIQAENEISAINMIFGSYACGMRSMTSSSGPGISLKQEGISYLCANAFPAVIANVQRWGAGLGSLDSSQCDYLRETRGGGNGDYRVIVYVPNTIQEMVDLTYESFDIAEKYRNPVEILSEAALGQMMEPVAFPEFKERKEDLGWTFDGTNRDHERVPAPQRPKLYREKYELIAENEQKWESEGLEDAEFVFVSIGLASRTTKNAVKRLRARGEKVGFIRPITAWPFPYKAFGLLPAGVTGMMSVENNDAGQVVEDVALAAKKMLDSNIPIYGLFTGQKIPKTTEIIEEYDKMLAGQLKEVF